MIELLFSFSFFVLPRIYSVSLSLSLPLSFARLSTRFS
jgi:hypothetical protein